MKKGIFVTLEGPDGSGKSSVVKLMEEYLREKKVEYIVTREPGGIDIAEEIRKVILDKKNTNMDMRTEALLYAAARRQHIVEKIIPALKEGKVVLCDRFIDSSLAYQGYGRGIGIDEVKKINEFAIEGHMPDITIYLDIEPEVGLMRIAKNKNREVNRLDLENIDFHKKVRCGYHILIKQFPNRIKTVNANKSLEEVFMDVKKILKEKFEI